MPTTDPDAKGPTATVPALEAPGLRVPVKPDGAFYVYPDVSALTDDSLAWCLRALDEIGVVLTPGIDFAPVRPGSASASGGLPLAVGPGGGRGFVRRLRLRPGADPHRTGSGSRSGLGVAPAPLARALGLG